MRGPYRMTLQRRFLLLLALCLLSTHVALAAPAPPSAASLTPKGFTLTGTVKAKVWTPDETDVVAVYKSTNDTPGRVCVIRPNGQAVWATMQGGGRDLPAPVQGGARQTLAQLVFPIAAPGARLLLVTCYMADVYVAVVFRPAGAQLREVFQAGFQDGLAWDAAQKRLTMRRYVEEGTRVVALRYRWDGRTFVIDRKAAGKRAP